jgi:hypothetical protein
MTGRFRARACERRIARSFLSLLFCVATLPANAALPAAATNVVDTVISKAVNANGVVRGFAANDPLFAQTYTRIAQTTAADIITSAQAGTVTASGGLLGGSLSVAGTATWLGLLFALSVGAGYNIVDMGTQNWQLQNAAAPQIVRTPQSAYLTPALPPSPTYAQLSSPPSPSGLPIDYSNPGIGMPISYPGDAPICAVVTYTSTATTCAASQPDIETNLLTLYRLLRPVG